jgi:WD40 repeat protein/serine/threonine protein kinase
MQKVTPMDDLTGQTIRGYEIQERIGEGGFGVVYRAHQPIVRRDVVVKAILPVYANNPDFIRSFEAEAQLIARLEHLHIVPLYDYWRGQEGAFLVMRWLRGGSLLDHLSNGPWSLNAVLRLINQIAGGLATAHRNNIIHQDIKPANILLDQEGNAYLTDFGLAKDLETDTDLSVSNVNASVRGSPAYISPEQIRRAKITPRTDIYSMGIVLYELLCGEHPFGTPNVVELLRHQLNTQLPAIQKYRPDLPDTLNIVLWRATAKDPDVRYASAFEMAEAFHNAVQQHTDEDSPVVASRVARGATAQPITGVINESDIDALIASPPNPYKGLRAFQEADAADFYGREALITVLIRRLTETGEGHRFLAVVGPSGSGKSSVVKAGVIPAIRSGRIPAWRKWFIIEMTPGEHPLAELENAVLKIAPTPAPDIQPLLQQQDGLHQAIQAVLPANDQEVILVIDQFEELFTLVTDEQDRAHFLNLLHHTILVPASRARVLLTLRADFYDRPLLYAGFGDLIRKRTEVILPMSAAEIEEAIVAPAARVGLTLEAGLEKQIVADVIEQPSVLPLLQFTLTELYERRVKDRLTLDAYQSTGGVSGALARRANELYEQMSPQQKAVVEQIFLRLVTLGERVEDTRRRALQSEFMSLATADVQQVIDSFGRYRLLTFDRDPITRTPTIEVAHEALIRNWDKLREWLNQNRDNLRLHRQLATAVTEWEQSGHDSSFLASGARLAQFESLARANALTLNDTEREYLQTSLQQRAREARNRQTRIAALIIMLLGVTVLAFVAVVAWAAAVNERERADQTAQVARSRELAASALLAGDQADLSLLLSLEALNTADTFEARNSLLTTLQRYSRLETVLSGHTDWVRTVAYSPDGRLIASAGRDHTIRIWDMYEKRMIDPVLTGHNDWVNAVAFSADGKMLASGGDDGSLFVWDMNSSPPTAQRFGGHNEAIWSVAFSPDGQQLASGGADNAIRLWDTHTGEGLAANNDHTGPVYTLDYSPDGARLASGSEDNTVRLWDARTLEALNILEGHTNWVLSVAFNPRGSVLASGSADNTIRLWDVESARQIAGPLRGHQDWVRALQFFPDGRRLASGGADGLILFWDGTTAVDGYASPGNSEIWGLDISPDGEHITSGGTDSPVYIWHSQPQLGTTIARQAEQIAAAAISPDGSLLASAGGLDSDFAIHLWNIADHTSQAVLEGHTSQITALAFHPTRPLLASGSVDRTVIIWDITNTERPVTLPLSDSVFAIAFNVQGDQLAVGDNTGAITIWDTRGSSPDTWTPLGQPSSAHTDRVLALAYHPNGALLASGSRDTTIRLWDTSPGKPAGEPLTKQNDVILSLAFSPDGSLLASSGRDTTIHLWAQSDGIWEANGEPLRGHRNWVMDVKFSPDGALLASASGDRSVILWDVRQRAALGSPLVGHTDWINTLAFSPDNTHLYSGGRDGTLTEWVIGLTEWRVRACQIANRNLRSDEQQRYFRDTPEMIITCPDILEENS